jgi:hypothetical protein
MPIHCQKKIQLFLLLQSKPEQGRDAGAENHVVLPSRQTI